MSGKNPLGNGREPQSYEGINVIVPLGGWQLIKALRAPTTSDKKYPIGSIWVNTATATSYQLMSAPGNWVSLAGSGAAGSFASVNSTGDITTSGGNVVISGAAKQLQVEGGAVTDFIGTATLVAGTVTVANTNIAATDRIFIQRIAANASTTLGETSYTISAATSFTITSLILGTPGSTQTGDLSSVAYFIVRQL